MTGGTGGEIVHKVEGDWGESDYFRDEGSNHECQDSECVVVVPGVPGLVCRTVPRKVEKKVGLVGVSFLGEALSPERGEGGNGPWEPCRSGVNLRRGTGEPKAGKTALVLNRTQKGRQACLSVETH